MAASAATEIGPDVEPDEKAPTLTGSSYLLVPVFSLREQPISVLASTLCARRVWLGEALRFLKWDEGRRPPGNALRQSILAHPAGNASPGLERQC